ncbi:RNA-binding S4 domain-containing protein [Shumkonia mesophila]|uniref:RNA-binding S4 domain-containing protein n=1 Tax=Shumkonia mesophila TaxID=2838854 RepID=UPI002934F350|nr:RNA-binding S4 domain-containing protein [Shumkonia mesophila]
MTEPTLRIDKWLWFARFFKSRTLAAKVCGGGRLRVNGEPIGKAHQMVRTGDVLTFPQGHDIRVVRVLALGTRRGPAPEARALYDDLEPPVARSRAVEDGALFAWRDPGSGRPTKSERRAIDRLKGEP